MPQLGRLPPRPFKAKQSSFEAAEFFRVESIPPAREGDAPGARLTHKRQSRVGQSDEAFGDRVMSKGEHRFIFTILSAHSPSGNGLCLGVAAAEHVGHASTRHKYGIRVSDGRCVSYPSPDSPSGGRSPNVRLSEGFMSHRESVRAVGRRVEVIVDMDRRRLFFSVDGAAHVDSGVLPETLPDALVPWVQLFFKSDAISLSQHRSRPTNGAPPSPQPPVLVPPSARFYDYTRFEAGPWTS